MGAPPPPQRWNQTGTSGAVGRALAAHGDRVYVANAAGLQVSTDGGTTFAAADATGLPKGIVLQLLAPSDEVLIAFVWGKGFHRSTDGGASFTAMPELALFDILDAFLQERPQLLPFEMAVSSTDPNHLAIAGPGGLHISEDQGATWTLTLANPGPADLNMLFTDVAIEGDVIFTSSQQAATLLPPGLTNLIAGGVFVSRDRGALWDDLTGDLPVTGVSSVAVKDGVLYAGALDGGLFRHEGEGRWTSLGGPVDVVSIEATGGGVAVASATRGLWRWEPDGSWTQAGTGPAAELSGRHGLLFDGSVHELVEGTGEAPPTPAGGTVYVALSFHGNLYHSYRGDTPDDDGYGLDIDVIRASLDWLDRYPDAHADWDIENYFSVDGWLASDAPDIITRIRDRVATGQDAVRLMSWNNGAVASQDVEEFTQSIERAKTSLVAAFGEFDPGVQPQENMFSPDHIALYPQLGIEWVTLFNSMSPFTGPPLDVPLEGTSLYNPVTITHGDASMTYVPVYSHADVLDHGGLRAWSQQLSDLYPGDVLLVIHFDADGETWINFDGELERLQGAEHVRYTTIQDYLDTHDPVETVPFVGDHADGIGDGFSSWGEKDINHEVFTEVVRSREKTNFAKLLAPNDANVSMLSEQSLEPRLLALSTTNYGLATPYLHPDREVSARGFAAEAQSFADQALAAAEALSPVPAGTIELVNPRPASGAMLVSMDFEVPAAVYTDLTPLAVRQGGIEVPVWVEVVDANVDPVQLRGQAILDVDANGITQAITWTYDTNAPATAMGSANTADLDSVNLPLELPFTTCNGETATAVETDPGTTMVDVRGVHVERRATFDLALCDGMGTVTRTLSRFDGLAGTIIAIDAQMGAPSRDLDTESIALTPMVCPAALSEITWAGFRGESFTRPARQGLETWNGQTVDGWLRFVCADGPTVGLSHRVVDRTSMGFLPVRTDGDAALLAPLGTLWGDTPWHDGRRIGGFGLGDIVGIIAPQFNPSSPDWSGKRIVYTLFVSDDPMATATLEGFAHPPMARVGAYQP